jgi:hypothetical protein
MRRTKPIWPTRRGIAEEECAKRSQTWSNWVMWAKTVAVWGVARPRSEMCKTNPISPGRRRVTEGIVQNEAKLGVTGVCGQRQVWRGARLGRGVECAERTQFPPAGGNWPRKLCETNPIWGRRGRVPEAKCAKRTQFGPAGRQMRKTNPISTSEGRSRAGTPNPRRGEACKTKPIRQVNPPPNAGRILGCPGRLLSADNPRRGGNWALDQLTQAA